jgi:hypothetical protein
MSMAMRNERQVLRYRGTPKQGERGHVANSQIVKWDLHGDLSSNGSKTKALWLRGLNVIHDSGPVITERRIEPALSVGLPGCLMRLKKRARICTHGTRNFPERVHTKMPRARPLSLSVCLSLARAISSVVRIVDEGPFV